MIFLLAGLLESCSSLGIILQGGSGGFPPLPPSLPPPPQPSYQSLGIEHGHLPPPGSCKIWYPNKPAGQQPPPTSCDNAIAQAPLNSWVLSRDKNDPDVLIVMEIISLHPKAFNETHYVLNK